MTIYGRWRRLSDKQLRALILLYDWEAKMDTRMKVSNAATSVENLNLNTVYALTELGLLETPSSYQCTKLTPMAIQLMEMDV